MDVRQNTSGSGSDMLLYEFFSVPRDSSAVWWQAYHLGERLNVSKGAVVVAGGSISDALYVVEQGELWLFRTMLNGREKRLMRIGPGSVIGEVSLFDGVTNLSSIAAGKASVLYRFSKECVYKVLVPQYPDIALCLLRSLARKTRLFANQSVTLSVRELPLRICRFLRLQASMLPDGTMDRRIVPELNQQELASLLGVHRVTLNKALRDLERDGVIGPYSRHEVYVLNTQHFMELVEMEI